MNNKIQSPNIQCACCENSKTGNPAEWINFMYHSSREVMRQKRSRYLFFPLTLFFLFLFVVIPVMVIPSNTFALQFSLYTTRDYAILALLAVLGSVLLLTHMHSFFILREGKKAGVIATGAAGGASSIFASIFGAASCPMCVASLFGFLGLGTVGFLINYQWLIFVIAIFMVMTSLYFASKKVMSITQHIHEP